ncbi:MAG: tRNA lysidine(34) synthetase TilS [Candidatus Wallbacteria bacterium]|nr:tRNA lysidine(34) synthetase TilS [Candidatus Wallbacteria bacterium]
MFNVRNQLFSQICLPGDSQPATGSRFLLAFSGGPDSVFLAHYFLDLLEKYPKFSVILAYFNHQLRTDSKEEEKFVKAFALSHGLKLITGRGDVRKTALAKKISLEMAAREMRYKFLNSTMDKTSADLLVLGHNQDDQAETLLLHLIRGCGNNGFSGMAVRGGRIWRPILTISKKRILDYLAENGTGYFKDYTNDDLKFERNFIRREIVPRLLKVNSGSVRHLSDTCRIAGSLNQYLDRQCNGLIREITVHDQDFYLLYCKKRLLAEHEFIQSEVVRRLFGCYLYLDQEKIHRILNLLHSETGKQLTLCKEVLLENCRDELLVLIKNKLAKWVDIYIEFKNGKITIPLWNVNLRIASGGTGLKRDVKTTDMITYPLKVRLPKTGDTFSPAGSGVTKKLSRYFQEKEIPAGIRKLWPVLTDGADRILWLPGLAKDNRAVRNALELTLEGAIFEK